MEILSHFANFFRFSGVFCDFLADDNKGFDRNPVSHHFVLEGQSNPTAPVVHVLISEPFFWDKVETTLSALGRVALVPEWEGDILQQLLAQDPIAMVVDLENEHLDAVGMLKKYLESGAPADLPVLAFASHEREDLLTTATELGATSVARSTFASSLVRILQNLCATESDNGGQVEAS